MNLSLRFQLTAAQTELVMYLWMRQGDDPADVLREAEELPYFGMIAERLVHKRVIRLTSRSIQLTKHGLSDAKRIGESAVELAEQYKKGLNVERRNRSQRAAKAGSTGG